MKKLKLWAAKYGNDKWGSERFIATVYVKRGKVIVESDDPIFREQVQKEIERGAYAEGFRIAPSREESGTRHKADDPRFLEALTYATGIWYKRFNGWVVFPTRSQIVEE